MKKERKKERTKERAKERTKERKREKAKRGNRDGHAKMRMGWGRRGMCVVRKGWYRITNPKNSRGEFVNLVGLCDFRL